MPGTLAEPVFNSGDRRHFVRVRMDDAGKVYSSGTQSSHMLSSLAASNGLLDIPAGARLAEGERVQVWKWEALAGG
jgi:molybdopterin molybdotransferase